MGLGIALGDVVNLGVAPTLHTDVHCPSWIYGASQLEDGLVGLESEDVWLHQLDQGLVNCDQVTLLLAVGHYHHLLVVEALSRLH